MRSLVVSSSLDPSSRSRLLATALRDRWRAAGRDVDYLDLRELALPACDGGAVFATEAVRELRGRVAAADAYVLASPIYVYSVSAGLKNAVELAGRAMEDKMVGFLCAAGGARSYMAVMAFANVLMLDYRVVVLPRYVYATAEDFEGDRLRPAAAARLEQFGGDFQRLGAAIARARADAG